ncbi:SDR family oxidoreductase [Williamsia sterculiae]|nr:SDR family oxidoreductase [Williamsia sterculiae]
MTTRTVFITGAAAGIGRATALGFAKRGYTVGAFDIDDAGLATLSAEIEALGATAVVGHLDVTDAEEFATRLREFVAQAGGRLDVLVNNAGILVGGRFEEIPVEKLHREVDINCKGVVNGLHAGFEHLRATPGSVAINLASASAIYGQAELADYSATKHFVRGITEALDIEWGAYGVRVVAIWPLFVQTAMTTNLKTNSTERMGIKLGPQDVADRILDAAEPNRFSKAIHQVHYTVGNQTRFLQEAARFSPVYLTRVVNRAIAKAH